jgi:CheY-like chemotaxis protein
MSHELRTPLNGVIGLAEVLARAPLAPEHGSIATELLASAGRLNGLVNQLLDTLEAGQAEAGIAVWTADAAPLDGAGARLPDRALRVLVADDNPTNRRVAELMLTAVGAEVASVENGAEAVAATGAEAFDLILMDLKMPVMDGLDAITAIREAEAAEGRPRRSIFVLSANTAAEDVAASLAAGADGHLGKPVRPEALMAALQRATGR